MMTHRHITDNCDFRKFIETNLHEYSSLQINLPRSIATGIIHWGQDYIDNDSIYKNDNNFGREKEIHVTVLYGIHSQLPDESIKLLTKQLPFEVHLGEISLFTNNEEFDVVKITVSSPKLIKLNKLLKVNLKNTQTFPDYNPHVTIAYVKKGRCSNLAGRKDFNDIKWTVNTLIFSSRTGDKTPIRF